MLVEAAVRSLPCDHELIVTGAWPAHVKQQTNSTVPDKKKYKMLAEPRGYAIIINNKEFKAGPRTGTDVDATALVRLFTYLGFLTKCYKDLKADEMRKVLKEVADKDHEDFDCLLVAVLAHGGVENPPPGVNKNPATPYSSQEVVSGTDNKNMRVSEIVGFFTGKTKHSLNGKPKLFFIQACRGTMTDLGVEMKERVDHKVGSAGLLSK